MFAVAALLILSPAPDPEISSEAPGSGDLDRIAPFLGLTPLDAEDLARDARAGAGEDPAAPTSRASAASSPSFNAGPPWTALLPSLTLSFEQRSVTQLKGSDVLGLRSGTIVLIQATFGALELPSPQSPPARRGGGVSLASLRSEVTTASPSGVPSIAEVQQAAEQAALVHLQDAATWRGRARAAAWLPEVTANYQRNVGQIDTLGVQSDIGVDSQHLEDVSRYGVRATWQLSQLVFAREEINAAQAALDLQRSRQELLAHVTELYFDRLRAIARAARSDDLTAPLKAAELTAQLDALTAGFFSERLRELASQ